MREGGKAGKKGGWNVECFDGWRKSHHLGVLEDVMRSVALRDDSYPPLHMVPQQHLGHTNTD